MHIFIIEINSFRGDLRDVSAETAALVVADSLFELPRQPLNNVTVAVGNHIKE